MRLQHHDIIPRRERDGRTTIWLSERLLIAEFGLEEKTLRTKHRHSFLQSVSPAKKNKDILPDTGKSWRFARLNGGFYYDFDRLPASRREALPGKEELLRLQTDRKTGGDTYHNHLKSEVEAILKTGYSQYLHHYRGYKDELCHTLARSCAVLNFAAETLSSGGAESATAFFTELANVLSLVGCEYLPKNWRRLKEKVDAITNGVPITEVVKVKREGWVNLYRDKKGKVFAGGTIHESKEAAIQRKYPHETHIGVDCVEWEE
jgi:hypothetical protein